MFNPNVRNVELPRGEGTGLDHRNDYCENFRTLDGALRYHSMMDSLGATALHEFTHYEALGRLARPTFVPRQDGFDRSYVVDYAIGPYMAYDCIALGAGKRCLYNAYNYQWMASEVGTLLLE